MSEKVLLSQPFEDHRSSFIDESGAARRDFYMESVGFGTLKFIRLAGSDDTSVITKFTDLGVCGTPLVRFPDVQIGEILFNTDTIESVVRYAAAERDEQPDITLPDNWYQ